MDFDKLKHGRFTEELGAQTRLLAAPLQRSQPDGAADPA